MSRSPSLDEMMEQAVVRHVFPDGVLLCARGAKPLYLGGVGRANGRTIFDLASLTKPLATALSVAVLMEEKGLGLGTSLGDVLVDHGLGDKASITVEMLLRHTSGLPAHRCFFERLGGAGFQRQGLRRLLLTEPLENQPGEKQVYSDLGYMFLSWVVERISGQRLDHFVHKRIYAPLGINDLGFRDLIRGAGKEEEGGAAVMPTRNCPWRGRVLFGEVEDENAWVAGGVEGHAGLFGSVVGVHRLCHEILAVLKGDPSPVVPAVIREFVKKNGQMTMVGGFDTPSKDNSSSGRFFSEYSVGHLGFTGTSFWMDPVDDKIVILLTNRVHPSRSNMKIREFRPRIHDVAHGLFSRF